MEEYTFKERLSRCFNGKDIDRPPAVCFTQTATVGQMESTGSFWPDAHLNTDKMVKLAAAGHDHIGFESIRVPFNCTAEPKLFGCKVKDGSPNIPPSVQGSVVKDSEDINSLRSIDMMQGEVATILESIEILKKEYPEVPLIGSMLGPVTLAENLNGARFFVNMAQNDELVPNLLEFTSEFNKEYARAMVERGVEYVVMLDPVCNGQLLGRDYYTKFAQSYQQNVVDTIHDLGAISVIHVCGNNDQILDLLDMTGTDGISLDHKTNVQQALDQINNARYIGNLDPSGNLYQGTPEKVAEEVKNVLNHGVDIPAPGCAVVSNTPDSNLKALVETTRMNGTN